MTSVDEYRDSRVGRSAPTVDVLSRGEFLDLFAGEYQSGQHVTMLGPTQRGKTTLAQQMLVVVISPEHKAVVLAGKPPHRDPVMSKAAQRLNLDIVEEWPPTPYRQYRNRSKNGYVLRPHQTMTDITADNENVRRQFGRGIMGNYGSKKPVITVADETHHIHNDYGLKKVCEAPLMRGAPHNAMWSLVQRGRNVSMLVYDQPEWILIAYDPDADNQKRYADIGGVDPRYLRQVLPTLQTRRGDDGRSTVSEFLCIRRSGPELFIVDTT